jgi:hypothetical protein
VLDVVTHVLEALLASALAVTLEQRRRLAVERSGHFLGEHLTVDDEQSCRTLTGGGGPA